MYQPNPNQQRHSGAARWLSRPAAVVVLGMVPFLALTRVAKSAPANTDPFAAEMPAPADAGVTSAVAALDAARQHVSGLQASLDRNQADAAALSQEIIRAGADLAKQRDELARDEQALASHQQAADAAKAALEHAKAAYDSTWKGEINSFEASEIFRTTKADADAARADAARREEADLKQLASTEAFKRAQEAVAQTEQALQSLSATRPSSDSDVADAGQTAAEAKARLADLQNHYLGEDAQLQAARAKAMETGAAFDKFRQEFGQQLPQLPAVTSARSALDAQQSAYDDAASEIDPNQAARDAKVAAVRTAADAIAADRETASRLEKDAYDLTVQLAAARADVERAETAAASAQAAAHQRQQTAALAAAREKAGLAEQQARQQAALAAQQAAPAVVPATPFDNPPQGQVAPGQPPVAQPPIAQPPMQPGQVPQGQVVPSPFPPAQDQPGQNPPSQIAPVPPGQSPPGQFPPGAYVSLVPGQYAAPTAPGPVTQGYTYAYPYTNSYPYNQPVVVDPQVCIGGYSYPYTYSYSPYEVYIGSRGGRYYVPYRERDVVIRGGGGSITSYYDVRRAPELRSLGRGPSVSRYQVREEYQSPQHSTVRGNVRGERGAESGRGGNHEHGR